MIKKTTQTIVDTTLSYVKGTFDLYGMLTTKRMIYQMMKVKRYNEPHLFSDRDWGSTYGTTRSMLSEICKNKDSQRIEGLLTFKFEGVDYFYTSEEQLQSLAVQNNGKIDFTNSNNAKIREHCNTQFHMCGIFEKLGFNFWVSKLDTSGEKNKTKYDNKTISDVFEEKILKIQTKDDFYWIDFVVFDGEVPILQLEVEESTDVHKGMERMSNTKDIHPNIQSFITSTKENYEKKFKHLSEGTYKDLSAKFIEPKKIESLYKRSLKIGDDPKKLESFKKTVFNTFNLIVN